MKTTDIALYTDDLPGRISDAAGLVAGMTKLLLLRAADLTAIFPLRTRYFLTGLPFFFAWLFFHGKRRAVRNNLRIVLGREPRRRDVLRVFLEYGRYYAECADLTGFWSEHKTITRGPDFPPAEPAFLGLTFHLGNFEIFGLEFQPIIKSDFTVIAERLKPEFLSDYFRAKRRRYHMNTIPHDDPRAIIRELENGSPIGIVCDRLVGGRGVPSRLFGKPVRLPLSIVGFALRRRIPIYVAYCAKENGGVTLFCKHLDPTQSFGQTIAAITAILEDAIRKYPFQWHVLNEL